MTIAATRNAAIRRMRDSAPSTTCCTTRATRIAPPAWSTPLRASAPRSARRRGEFVIRGERACVADALRIVRSVFMTLQVIRFLGRSLPGLAGSVGDFCINTCEVVNITPRDRATASSVSPRTSARVTVWPVRVAFYSPFIRLSDAKESGDHTQAHQIIRALEAQGHTVKVVSEYRTRRLWRSRKVLRRLPGAVRSAHREVRRFAPDAWLTFVSERAAPDVLGPLLTRRPRVPYVIYKVPYRGGLASVRRRAGWADVPGYALNRLALATADRLVANKASDFDSYAAEPALRSKLSLLWPAVPTDTLFPDAGERARRRAELGIDDRTAVILSLGRLGDKRGRKKASTQFLIDCVGDLLGAGHAVRLVVVGDGSGRADLERHARGLGDAVTFVGNVDHDSVRSYYNAADVFAYPGYREPIGLVYLEAQACGVPVVAFASGSIPTIVRDGATGLLVEPMDRPAFAAALERLV